MKKNYYDHRKIEGKWQKEWEKKKIYNASDSSTKPKFYSLIEFPYPSGDGLHVGHPRPYIGMDVISRLKRMQGYNVLYPIGWDAFGLPTENYAIKTGKDPALVTKKNSDNFRRQIKSIGISFDWSREVNTTDPKYYKWTQWIFLQFLKKGLAYKAKMAINWCTSCKIGLANEEVVGGACERCGGTVEKREKEQWMLAITKYADRLDKDLDQVDYLPHIKLAQKNWIGKSEGAEIKFTAGDNEIKIFTTRPDTIFGATFLALAPEVAKKLTGKDFGIKVDTDRENKEKIGVDTGLKAKNPANGEMIPIFAVNYVSAEYGTGAIMGVPGHDERDHEFAKKYDLPIRQVILPNLIDTSNPPRSDKENTFRNMVLVVLFNPKTKKYLTLKWKTQPWITFITGGVEDGEKRLETAKREITEETGYKNFKLIRSMGMREASFFANHKNVNRKVNGEHFLFELLDEEQMPVDEKEKEMYDIEWLSFEELEKTKLQHAEAGMILDSIRTGKDNYDGEGVLMNSGKFDGMQSEEAKKKITESLGGKLVTKFKLRDWIFSRQRYWGEPIPVIHCAKCGIVPVSERDLPVKLPKVKNYQPTDSGESPLANISKWVNVKCPKCKSPAKRETDTMPNWAGSSWYYLRYCDPHNDKEFVSRKKLDYWMPACPAANSEGSQREICGGVDWYNGGNEHTTLHLLYSRFWHKFLYDLGLVPTSEPYKKRTSHGIILAEGGEKMSKSRGNVINPDDIVKRFGADTLRLYEMFMGPFDQAIAWSEEAIIGPRRFLERVWKLGSPDAFAQVPATQRQHSQKHAGSPKASRILHKTIKKVTEDIETMRFNTAISALMILSTEMEGQGVSKDDYKKFLQILAPFAPHIAEELWHLLGEKSSINTSKWPKWDKNLIVDDEVKVVVQVNGKLRGEITVSVEASEEVVKEAALRIAQRYIEAKPVKKIIYVRGRLINIVV